MTDKMCLVMNVFNHVDGDEDVVYRYRIYAGKRFIDALEKVMFDEDKSTVSPVGLTQKPISYCKIFGGNIISDAGTTTSEFLSMMD